MNSQGSGSGLVGVPSKGQVLALRPVYLLGAQRAKRNLRTVKVWAQHLYSDVTALKQLSHAAFWISMTFLVAEIVKLFASAGNGSVMLVL